MQRNNPLLPYEKHLSSAIQDTKTLLIFGSNFEQISKSPQTIKQTLNICFVVCGAFEKT